MPPSRPFTDDEWVVVKERHLVGASFADRDLVKFAAVGNQAPGDQWGPWKLLP
ncbi:hypothetical protein AB0J72_12190 [Dactylosporangium sp. NPDC049742]|uniref:hypothetical protein n=1 Tax=Dactylosporangium sp. NPDC049742 TaxID=3154737 RepID=UPI003415D54E